MSSIKNNDNEVRRTREEYQTREAENAKKQKLKAKKSVENQNAEIEAIKEKHAQQMGELKAKATEALTRRDMEYQKEISDLRKMHGEQLKRVAHESDGRKERTEEVLKGEINRTKETSERQRANLSENFTSELSKRDKAMAEYAEQSREAMKAGIEKNRENLNSAHKKEVNSLIKDRDSRIEDAQTNYNQLRKGNNATIDNLKQTTSNRVDSLSENYEMNLRQKEADSVQRANADREGFNMGLKENRNRYRRALEKEQEGLENARKDLTDSVHGRLGKKFSSLSTEVAELKRQQERERIDGERRRDMEVRNLRNSFGENIADYERQRKELVGASNEKTAVEIKKMNDKNTDALQHANKFYQEKIGMDSVRTQEKVANLEGEFERKSETAEINNTTRFDKLKNFNELEREKMANYFNEATQTMRQSFEETLREMRMKNSEEKNRIFQTVASQSRESELKWQEKVAGISSTYEKKIADLEAKHNKALKEQATELERRMGQNDKKSRAEHEVAVSQLSNRLSQREDTFKRELADLRDKHQETLANLVKNRQS